MLLRCVNYITYQLLFLIVWKPEFLLKSQGLRAREIIIIVYWPNNNKDSLVTSQLMEIKVGDGLSEHDNKPNLFLLSCRRLLGY